MLAPASANLPEVSFENVLLKIKISKTVQNLMIAMKMLHFLKVFIRFAGIVFSSALTAQTFSPFFDGETQ